MDYNKAALKILNACKQLIDKKCEILEFDRTFSSRISRVVKKGRYEIEYKGTKRIAKSFEVFQAGDYVRVCAPSGDWNDLFIVCKIG